MAETGERVQQIFFDALDLPPEEREAFVRLACAEDSACLEGVLALLRSSEEAASSRFMSEPFWSLPTTQPRVLGPYQILEQLGRGGMGVVFKAFDPRSGVHVAIKTLPMLAAFDLAVQRRFAREIKALARLESPHIVGALAAEQIQGECFLVMEYVDGDTFHEWIEKQGPLPVREACDLIRQVALGLQHAHDRDVVHRDIKPSNLMRTPEGVVKILDFGLARLMSGSSDGPRLTASGAGMGTGDFMAPEQSQNSHHIDARADLYALGCTLYFLLAGESPFAHRGTTPAKLVAHMQEAPPVLTSPEIPPALNQLLARLLAKDPADRPATANEVASTLEVILAAPDPVAIPPLPVPEKRYFPALGWALFSCLLLATLILGVRLGFHALGEAPSLMDTGGDFDKRLELVCMIACLLGAAYGALTVLRDPTRSWRLVFGAVVLTAVTLGLLAWGWPPITGWVSTHVTSSPRPILGPGHAWSTLLQFLKGKEARAFRFITCGHLHDNPHVTSQRLAAWKQGLRDWNGPAPLVAIDAQETVFALDLRTFDWPDGEFWDDLTAAYPNGMVFGGEAAVDHADTARTVVAKTGRLVPMVHGDWLLAVMQPNSQWAKWYAEDLDAMALAAELGLPDAEALRAQAGSLRILGLGPALDGRRISRKTWCGLRGDCTLVQEVSTLMKQGYPRVPAK